MHLLEAKQKINDALEARAWGSRVETEDVLEEMSSRLADPDMWQIDKDDIDLEELFEECLFDLREAAYSDVRNVFTD